MKSQKTEPRRTRREQTDHLSRWRERSARIARRVRVAVGDAMRFIGRESLTRHPHRDSLPPAGEGEVRALASLEVDAA